MFPDGAAAGAAACRHQDLATLPAQPPAARHQPRRVAQVHVMSCHVMLSHVMLCHVTLSPRFNWRQLENVMEGVTEEQLLTQVRSTCMLVGIRDHLVGSCFSCPSCSLRSATARPSRSGSWLGRRAWTWGCLCEAR